MPLSTFGAQVPDGATPSRGYTSTRDDDPGHALRPGQGGAAGGRITTIADYAAFANRVCHGTGLSPETRIKMLTPISPVPPGTFPGPTSFGLGWAIMEAGNETIVLHDGNNGAYRSLVAILPETGGGIVVLTNGANGAALIEAMVLGAP